MGAETSASDLTEQTNPKPPSDVTETLLHQEIRSALARMSDAERFRAVREAINTGDETFVSAATSASPILSGMSAAEQSAAREKWRQRHHEEAGQLNRLKAGLAELDRLRPMFQKWSNQLLEKPNAAAVAAAEESERLAKSAV